MRSFHLGGHSFDQSAQNRLPLSSTFRFRCLPGGPACVNRKATLPMVARMAFDAVLAKNRDNLVREVDCRLCAKRSEKRMAIKAEISVEMPARFIRKTEW